MHGLKNWEKWVVIFVMIAGLSSIIVYFNVRVFGWYDGAPYIAVVGLIVLMSFIITRHIKYNPVTTNFLRAAFIFEIMLCISLGVNVAYSLSVMREMSVAGQGEIHQTEIAKTQSQTMAEIAKFKSPQAQRVATRSMAASQQGKGTAPVLSKLDVFKQYDRWLFWIMIGELAVAGVSFFVLLSLSVFDADGNGIPDFIESKAPTPSPRFAGMAPPMSSGMLAARHRATGRRPMPGAHSHDIDDDDDEEGDDSPK